VRTMKSHTAIGDSRTIKCFRSCRHWTGPPTMALDKGRLAFEQAKLARRQARGRETVSPTLMSGKQAGGRDRSVAPTNFPIAPSHRRGL
jgi:hypothetical protein